MSYDALLFLKERQVIEDASRESMRPVEIGKRLFARTRVERVLRIRGTNVSESKNLARVVDGFAKRVGRVYRERILHEAPRVARLHGMIVRVGAVVPDSNAVCLLEASVADRLVDKQGQRIVRAHLESSARRQ